VLLFAPEDGQMSRFVKLMEHGQIFLVVLNTILVWKNKFPGFVLEFLAIVLMVSLDIGANSNALLALTLIPLVQGMVLGPLTLLALGI